MIDETVPVTPVTLFCISRVADLLVPQSQVARGVQVMCGGLAATYTGELLGWVATAHEPADLACPTWPEQPQTDRFVQLFAGPVVLDVVYRGADWRRAIQCVNSHLVDRCGLGAARVDAAGAEHAWHELSTLAHQPPKLRLVV